MFRPHRIFLCVIGLVTWALTAADTVFSILDAASLSLTDLSFLNLAIAAAAFDCIALCCVAIFSIQYAWRKEGIIKHSTLGRRILAVSCTSLSIIALAVSLASLITIKRREQEVDAATSKAAISSWAGHLAAQFAIWTLTCVTQVVLFTCPLWTSSKPESIRPVAISGPRDSVMSEIRTSNQAADDYMLEPQRPSSPLMSLPSPTFSARSSQSLKSWRDSLHSVVRPVTSRTKLISRPSFNRDARSVYSDNHSIATMSQSDGFDTWDTSSVDPQTKEVVAQVAAPSRGTALETIPGSRPASPARALDGPFPAEYHQVDMPLSPPPKMLPDLSRPPSPAVSEGHIHPLFRTESPTPPPAATPGTQILASPLSNQMIVPPRPYSRMRSNSRAGSPSLLVQHSQHFHDHTTSQRKSRSPSPPSRGMTPPIPDFVLNSTPRSSMSGTNERRKVSLQPSNSSP
ncbi:hypothetical protein B0J11DRAFT_91579 [Dendryphion nanum]|uniref:Uncharacterized protein n=1 Tax=Dendryphion nanum TaxID=256645 RepID=A0A9P9DEH1_9PLEO|nr:hypothetical protein B0J11DRAFT_91579 [Dendryphion nanum]